MVFGPPNFIDFSAIHRHFLSIFKISSQLIDDKLPSQPFFVHQELHNALHMQNILKRNDSNLNLIVWNSGTLPSRQVCPYYNFQIISLFVLYLCNFQTFFI